MSPVTAACPPPGSGAPPAGAGMAGSAAAAAAAAAGSARECTATRWPDPASARAIAAPIPRDDPVTRARRAAIMILLSRASQ